ncbi:MAG: hypothetical protein HYT27_01135 [Parcubacteria group bacterium]|nr:hypothetical protein [Parcubacteria group bacterium]
MNTMFDLLTTTAYAISTLSNPNKSRRRSFSPSRQAKNQELNRDFSESDPKKTCGAKKCCGKVNEHGWCADGMI